MTAWRAGRRRVARAPLPRLAGAALAVAALASLAGCAPAAPVAWPPPGAEPLRPVWVVRHGWHTRVAVRQADVDPARWPESRDLGPVAVVEVGWGDRDFYPKPVPSLLDAIDPVVRCTPAALHVGGLPAPPAEALPDATVVELAVPAPGLDGLAQFVHAHYERDVDGRPIRIRPGQYPRSWFYRARGRYHALAHNSNHWTAAALRSAGVPVAPAPTAGGVLAQAARFGARVGLR